jgi:hypothetical protein
MEKTKWTSVESLETSLTVGSDDASAILEVPVVFAYTQVNGILGTNVRVGHIHTTK